jgi:acetyl esterase/lipase
MPKTPILNHVHPELQPYAKVLPPMTFNARSLRLLRSMYRVMSLPKKTGDIHIENRWIPAKDSHTTLRLRLYRRPKSMPQPAPALLWMHGGGYILGKPEQDDACCIQYARQLDMLVVSVDYRVAPEHPFPCSLDDCLAALEWLCAQAVELGVDVQRIAIGGASAGGGLAAALAQLVHDRQAIQPAFQLLVYPMLDDRTSAGSHLADPSHLVWNQESNRFGWEAYLGATCGSADLPPYAVPSRRDDLSGLPPAWIGVGSLDLFHAEAVAYAQQLQACGVACELFTVPGAFHGFDQFAQRSQLVRDFRQAQIDAMRRNLFS